MLATLGLMGVAMIGVGLATAWLLRQRSLSSPQSLIVVGLSMWSVASAVVWLRSGEPFRESQGRSELVRSLDSLAWPNSPSAVPVVPPQSSAAGVQVASVESLVAGLEARLAAQPNDANGWVLLAQSYSFISNEEAVERALQRAVTLGMDEKVARERVASAQRSAPATDWVERAIGARKR